MSILVEGIMENLPKFGISETEDLLQWSALVAREKTALAYFFKKYYSLFYNYGLKICHDEQIVEDCIQDLFVKIWKRKKPFPEINSPKAYLLRSYKNNLLDKLVSGDNHDKVESFGFQHATESVQDKIIEDEYQHEIRAKIDRGLDTLPAREREIIYLKFYKNMSYQEIAEMLGINYQSVRNSVYASVKKMRKTLILEVILLLNSL